VHVVQFNIYALMAVHRTKRFGSHVTVANKVKWPIGPDAHHGSRPLHQRALHRLGASRGKHNQIGRYRARAVQ
jgi:hypothetical protein